MTRCDFGAKTTSVTPTALQPAMTDAGESAETARPPGSTPATTALLADGFHRHLDGSSTTLTRSQTLTEKSTDLRAAFATSHNSRVLAVAAEGDAALALDLQRVQMTLVAQPQDTAALALQDILLGRMAFSADARRKLEDSTAQLAGLLVSAAVEHGRVYLAKAWVRNVSEWRRMRLEQAAQLVALDIVRTFWLLWECSTDDMAVVHTLREALEGHELSPGAAVDPESCSCSRSIPPDLLASGRENLGGLAGGMCVCEVVLFQSGKGGGCSSLTPESWSRRTAKPGQAEALRPFRGD